MILPHSPLRLSVDTGALVSNWCWLAAQSGAAACGAAVKANGYGIGARDTVMHLSNAGCRDFFVATWAEAEALMPWIGNASLSVLHGLESVIEGQSRAADQRVSRVPGRGP